MSVLRNRMGPSTVVLDPGENTSSRDAVLVAASLSIINEKLPEYHRSYNNNNNKNLLGRGKRRASFYTRGLVDSGVIPVFLQGSKGLIAESP